MRCRARASEAQRDAPAAALTLLLRVCDAAGFTLQLDEHQLKNILKDIHVKYAAETMEELDTNFADKAYEVSTRVHGKAMEFRRERSMGHRDFIAEWQNRFTEAAQKQFRLGASAKSHFFLECTPH